MNLKIFSIKELEIQLPETFIGGDPRRDKRAILEAVNEEDPEFQQKAKKFFGPALFTFMAMDTHIRQGQRNPNTCTSNVMKAPARYAHLSPEGLMKSMTSQLAGNTDILEADVATIAGYEGVRIISNYRKPRGFFGINFGGGARNENEAPVEQSLTFMFVDNGKFASTILTSEPGVFSDLLPVFQDSLETFKLH